jgi:hypothetical protein
MTTLASDERPATLTSCDPLPSRNESQEAECLT